MAIRLSCADFTFPRLTVVQCCQLIAWLGIEYVDVGILKDNLDRVDTIAETATVVRGFRAWQARQIGGTEAAPVRA